MFPEIPHSSRPVYTRVGTINLVQPRLHSAESVIQTEITISCWDLPILLTASQHPRFSLIPSSFCPSPSVIALQHVSRSIQTLTPLKVKLAFGTPKEFLCSSQKHIASMTWQLFVTGNAKLLIFCVSLHNPCEALGKPRCCTGHLFYFKAHLQKLAYYQHLPMIRISVLWLASKAPGGMFFFLSESLKVIITGKRMHEKSNRNPHFLLWY